MTFIEIAAMIESTGLPNAYRQFKKNTAQPPPFICFYYDQSGDEYADNSNYQSIERLYIELYSADKDFESEAVIEAALANAGLTWFREETYIASEELYEVIYQADVLINQEESE